MQVVLYLEGLLVHVPLQIIVLKINIAAGNEDACHVEQYVETYLVSSLKILKNEDSF